MFYRPAILCVVLSTWAVDLKANGWMFGVGTIQCSDAVEGLRHPDTADGIYLRAAIGAWAAGLMSAYNSLNDRQVGRGLETGVFDLTKAECIKHPEWNVFRAVLEVYGDLSD